MNFANFDNVLDTLDGILSHQQKQAEAIADGNVIEGNRKATEGQGDKISEKKETENAVDTEKPEPSRTDNADKSVKYQINSDSADTKVVDKSIKSDAEKSARMGNSVLNDIKRLLKKAEGDMEYEEEDKESRKEEYKDDTTEPKDMSKEPSVEEQVDEPLDEEDAQILEALGAKTAAEKKMFLMAKKAGIDYSKQMQAQNSPTPEMQKTAAHMAGSIIADMEQKGLVYSVETMEKVGASMQQVIADAEKSAFNKGYNVANANMKKQAEAIMRKKQEKEELVKEAAATSVEAIMQEMARRQIGNAANQYGGAVNPT